VLDRLRAWVIGAPKNLLDPHIHHSLALIAFFAWVGLGSDGLSSSSYGPEEAFLQLGAHRHLALYLVVAMVATIFLISASYSYIIELFPSGGGGYLVATKLLGTVPGVVSGAALVVDYVLTIAISVASGIEAIFSFLPPEVGVLKLAASGLSNKQIAERLFISQTTVTHHLSSIYAKLKVSDRLELVVYAFANKLAKLPDMQGPEEVPLRILLPSFVISELKTAFQIGFTIFIPFLIIDLVVASVLMSMGMMMVPPASIALPFKLMLFVLADGWQLLIGALAQSFYT